MIESAGNWVWNDGLDYATNFFRGFTDVVTRGVTKHLRDSRVAANLSKNSGSGLRFFEIEQASVGTWRKRGSLQDPFQGCRCIEYEPAHWLRASRISSTAMFVSGNFLRISSDRSCTRRATTGSIGFFAAMLAQITSKSAMISDVVFVLITELSEEEG